MSEISNHQSCKLQRQTLPARWIPLRYHPIQAKLWNDNVRFKVVIAGRRSGKTEIVKRRLVKALAEKKPWKDPRYFYGAPTHPQAKRIAWDDLKDLTPKVWIDDISESEKCIKTVFGSRLYVLGLDAPQRIEGPPWDGCAVDEVCDQKVETFSRVIYPALADRNGWGFLTGVPKRAAPSSQIVRQMFERGEKGTDKEWASYTWKSEDILPAEVIEAAKRTLDAKTYLEQFCATFVTAGGAVYDSFDLLHNVRRCLYRPELPLFVGSDFNVSPMAWVIMQSPVDGVYEVIDEIWLEDCTTPRALNELHRRYSEHKGGFEFYGDATSRNRHTSSTSTDYLLILNDPRFRQLGRTVHYPHSNPAHADRYAVVNSACCSMANTRRLFVDPSCKHLINDLQNVYYDPGTRDAKETAELTHISDALGYILMYKISLIGEDQTDSDDCYGV